MDGGGAMKRLFGALLMSLSTVAGAGGRQAARR